MRQRKWSKQRIIQELQACHRQGVETRQIRHHDLRLHRAATLYFGGWLRALAAAVLEPPRRQWSKRLVISAIQAWHNSEPTSPNIQKHDSGLAQAAAKRFGSWRKALRAAGIEPKPPKWTKQKVIEEIRRCYRPGTSLKISTPEHRPLRNAACRCFGSWHEAMRAAGLKPYRNKWSKDRVVEELRRRYPMEKNLWMNNPHLAEAAQRYFGGRAKALAAAGFVTPQPKTQIRWSEQRIIHEIRVWQEGLALQGGNRTAPIRLYAASQRHFGSWNAALSAAGFPPPFRKWDQQSVIDEIQDMHERGVPLSRIKRENRKLVSAARRHFSGWSEAVVAAGFPPASQKPLRK